MATPLRSNEDTRSSREGVDAGDASDAGAPDQGLAGSRRVDSEAAEPPNAADGVNESGEVVNEDNASDEEGGASDETDDASDEDDYPDD